MKTIRVAAAIICDSFPDIKKIYATVRGYGVYRDQWEFPGGKIKAGGNALAGVCPGDPGGT